MHLIVVGLSGRTKSGKSTIAKLLADMLQTRCASFGGYVRAVAAERGITESRKTLSDLGESLIATDTPLFIENVLNFCDWHQDESVVIDGIRHAEVLHHLRTLFPDHFYHVHVDVNDSIRLARIGNSSLAGDSINADQHSTEIQVEAVLRQRADIIVEGDKDPQETARHILDWIARREGRIT